MEAGRREGGSRTAALFPHNVAVRIPRSQLDNIRVRARRSERNERGKQTKDPDKRI
jgi:hypothetical protein